MNKQKLIDEYVNLYRILWLSNSGLWTEDLKNMTEAELKKEIAGMKKAVEEKNSFYPGLNN